MGWRFLSIHHGVGLEPVNNLAPLINGTDPGKGVMEFEIRNGTDDAIYVTLDYAQPAADYSKSWIASYTELYTSNVPDDTCLQPPVTCPLDLPPGTETRWYPDMTGTLASPIGGVRVWEIGPGTMIEISPCEGCDAREYRLEPRHALDAPRTYRVALVVTDLAELAPRLDSEPVDVYRDTVIHPIYQPMEITGLVFDTLRRCLNAPDNITCTEQGLYRPYRALTQTIIWLDALTAEGRLSAAKSLSTYQPLPQPNTFGLASLPRHCTQSSSLGS